MSQSLKVIETLLYNNFRKDGHSVAEAERLAALNAPYYYRVAIKKSKRSNPPKGKQSTYNIYYDRMFVGQVLATSKKQALHKAYREDDIVSKLGVHKEKVAAQRQTIYDNPPKGKRPDRYIIGNLDWQMRSLGHDAESKPTMEGIHRYIMGVFPAFNFSKAQYSSFLRSAIYAYEQTHKTNPPSGWIPSTAVKFHKNGMVSVRRRGNSNIGLNKVRVYVVTSVGGKQYELGALHDTLSNIKASFKEQGITHYHLSHLGGQGSGAVYEATVTRRPSK